MSLLKKNIIYNSLGQFVTIVLGFFAVKYIFGKLGADVLGIIFFTSVVNMLLKKALDLGISSTTMREVSAYYESEPDYISDLIRTGSFFFWIAFVCLAIGLYFAAPILVTKWINLTTLDIKTATEMFRILGIASLLALPQSLYFSLFIGIQRMGFTNLIDVGFTVIRQFGTVAILAFGSGNLFHVIYLYAICYFLPILSYILVAFHFFPNRSFIPAISPGVIKRNFNFASKMTLQTIIMSIYQQLDKLIISKLMPIGVLGYYTFAFSNVGKAVFIQDSIIRAAFPSFCSLHGKKEKKRLLSLYTELQDLINFGIVPILAIIPFMLLPFFTYIFNNQVAHQLHLPTTLLCIGFFLYGTLKLPQLYATAVGKPEINVKNNFYSLIIILPLTAILIYYYGLIGAGLGIILRRLFQYFYAVPKYCNECMGISTKQWFWDITKIAILICVTYGIGWIFITIINDYSFSVLLQTYLLTTVFFLTSSYFMINDNLKNSLLRQLRSFKLLKIENI